MSASKTIKLMKEKEVEYVDLRFTDPRGKLQHLTMDGKMVDEKMLNEGVFFDGSSIAGWKAINESDMILKPDLERQIIDPFTSHNTMVLFCDVLDAVKKDPYERDPRSIAKKAEAYLKKSGIGDKAYFGPEAEFFVFDDVKYKNDMNETGFKIDSAEGPYNTGKDYENGNMGHRPGIKGGYFPVPPVDSAQDMRGEFLKALRDMGIKAEKHHHEVAPSQHELGMYFGTLTNQADNMQLYKYGVQMVAHSFGKTATFMPKPFENLTGNGCHAHISLWNGNKNLFLDKGDKLGLTRLAYNFLGGILNSAEALSSFFNPSINSYRRIDAPVTTSGATWSPSKISYTGNNRTHMIRIPDPGRFELRLMDGSANPYLLQAGVIAAGIDGIEKKRDPGQPLFVNMYTDGDNYPNIKKLPSDLENALKHLSSSEVLLSAFGEKNIASYLKLKQQELKDFNSKENFSKKELITEWEKTNTLDC